MPDTLAERYKANSTHVKACANAANRPDDVRIIAVSKTQPASVLIEAYRAGITTFGENYALELYDKFLALSALGLTPEWHFIGHLQTNKVKLLAPFVTMIHSVDSVKLAREISTQAIKNSRVIDICVQVNTSGEESKSGCEPTALDTIVSDILTLQGVRLCGLMTIPSFTATDEELRHEFSLLRGMRDALQAQYPEQDIHHLSMGMSGDYPLAIEEGATFVRIGTAIFGERQYPAR
ncbi:MAG: YggS family pyridoxal phosphate-dependent enzyme [Ignavibacteria bacterium]|nr:YggS family pyridoxal phosphate-dependent enzyme [Ignavibacteria bacterium]